MKSPIIEGIVEYMDRKGRDEYDGFQSLTSILELLGCQDDEEKAFSVFTTLLFLYADELLETFNGRS
ncbi:hypothetical protein Mame_02616 [Martelella mediterranea DSM 17316]|uniref:Uncharacterized protein n=2 Tax=Martelella mediterranea TaxID=293089 RepID=A0A1U9Z2W1_9HYPH|nr:hypothetical protein Mame_02616 [Martelella mediterranea DSM 17316]